MRNASSNIKNQLLSEYFEEDTPKKQTKSTDINVLLNRVKNNQKNTLKKHQETHGHTKAHMDYMKRKMREGMSFTDAHRLAMRRKGK